MALGPIDPFLLPLTLPAGPPQCHKAEEWPSVAHGAHSQRKTTLAVFRVFIFPCRTRSGAPRGANNTLLLLQVVGKAGVVNITASSGVAAAWGLHHYLTQVCRCHVSWDYDQLSLPDPLPDVNMSVTSVDRSVLLGRPRHRRPQRGPAMLRPLCAGTATTRTCARRATRSCGGTGRAGSASWTGWRSTASTWRWRSRGRRPSGSASTCSSAWTRATSTATSRGLPFWRGECQPPPALWLLFVPAVYRAFLWLFLSRQRMGNVRGWAGPLPSSWHSHSRVLQHRILARMRELGMVAVLPAFAGHVPRGFQRSVSVAWPTAPAKFTKCTKRSNTNTRVFVRPQALPQLVDHPAAEVEPFPRRVLLVSGQPGRRGPWNVVATFGKFSESDLFPPDGLVLCPLCCSPLLLDPTDPVFKRVGTLFMQEVSGAVGEGGGAPTPPVIDVVTRPV